MKAVLPALICLSYAAVQPAAQRALVPIQIRVVAAADSTPLGRTSVVVIAQGREAAPVFTGETGTVDITPPLATFTVRLAKAGYAPQDVWVAPQTPRPLDVRLDPATVITGRVTDDRGRPAVRVDVVIRRLEPGDGPQPAQTQVRTDDRGEYRLGNLIAGRYALYTERGLDLTGVFDNLPDGGGPAALADRNRQAREPLSDILTVTAGRGAQVDVALAHAAPSVEFPYSEGGVVNGRLIDEYGEPAAGWRVAVRGGGDAGMSAAATAVADDRGQFRVFHIPPGRHVVVVTNAADPEFGPPEAARFLPVYYPGRLDAAEALPLVIERGREVSGVDMIVPVVRGARVFGRVSPAAGTARVPVVMMPALQRNTSVLDIRFATAEPGGDFSLGNVPPGNYTLQAVSGNADAPAELSNFWFGALKIAVGRDDIGPIALSLTPTSAISGRITLEGGGGGVSPNEFRIAILPVDRQAGPVPALGGGALRVSGGLIVSGGIEPDSDWTFRIPGLATPTRFGLARAPQGWWLKSVGLGGINAAEEPAPFDSPDDSRDDVEIVLSPTGGLIAGRLIDDGSPAVDAYTVVAFSTDQNRLFDGSPYLQSTTSGSDGSFMLPTLPPGEYFVAAIEYSEIDPTAEEVLRPEALPSLAGLARRVTVGDRQQFRVDLGLIRTAR